MTIKTLFSPVNIKVHLKGLQNFAFCTLFFDFPSPLSLSLIPFHFFLATDPSPLDPNVIVRNYLRVDKVLYICRETITDVMSALQIHLFMQNKAKLRKVKLNVNQVLTRDYEQLDTWSIRKKQSQFKPKTNPIQTQYKANTNPIYPLVASGEEGTNPISHDPCLLFK